MNRRTFLATPVVFGLDALAGCSGGQAEEALASGLRRMKETGKDGLIVVAPADDAERRMLGNHLYRIVEKGPPEARSLLGSIVLIGLPRELALRRIGPNLPAHALVLLGPDGSLRNQSFYDLEADLPGRIPKGDGVPRHLLKQLTELAHGEGGSRLQARAAEIEKELSPEERATLARLETEQWKEASALLEPRADRLAPLLAWRESKAGDPLRGRLRGLLDAAWNAAPQDKPGARLPYGVTVEQGPVEMWDPCAYCGLEGGFKTQATGTFLAFLKG